MGSTADAKTKSGLEDRSGQHQDISGRIWEANSSPTHDAVLHCCAVTPSLCQREGFSRHHQWRFPLGREFDYFNHSQALRFSRKNGIIHKKGERFQRSFLLNINTGHSKTNTAHINAFYAFSLMVHFLSRQIDSGFNQKCEI